MLNIDELFDRFIQQENIKEIRDEILEELENIKSSTPDSAVISDSVDN